MICLRAFDTRSEVLAVLQNAGLATDRGHDAARADVFEVWPRVQVGGEWQDDASKPSKWTANIYRDLSAAETQALAPEMVDPPVRPARVCA